MSSTHYMVGAALFFVGALICQCNKVQNTPGAKCPDNAFCDRVDFGAGAVTICVSSSAELVQLKNDAATLRKYKAANP